MDAKIDLKAFTLPFVSNRGNLIAYITLPSALELAAISKPLGIVFTAFRKAEVDMLVLLKDWRLLVEDALENYEKKAQALEAIDAFFARRIDYTTIYDADTGACVESVTDDEKEYLQGQLLFFSAVWRYASAMLREGEMKDYITSLNSTEFQASLGNSPSSQLEEESPITEQIL